MSGNSAALESLETTFNQDLNGDGTIGLDHDGDPDRRIDQPDRGWRLIIILYGSGGSGPELQYMGAAVVAGQFGAWAPIGAVQTASGYDVAWKN